MENLPIDVLCKIAFPTAVTISSTAEAFGAICRATREALSHARFRSYRSAVGHVFPDRRDPRYRRKLFRKIVRTLRKRRTSPTRRVRSVEMSLKNNVITIAARKSGTWLTTGTFPRRIKCLDDVVEEVASLSHGGPGTIFAETEKTYDVIGDWQNIQAVLRKDIDVSEALSDLGDHDDKFCLGLSRRNFDYSTMLLGVIQGGNVLKYIMVGVDEDCEWFALDIEPGRSFPDGLINGRLRREQIHDSCVDFVSKLVEESNPVRLTKLSDIRLLIPDDHVLELLWRRQRGEITILYPQIHKSNERTWVPPLWGKKP